MGRVIHWLRALILDTAESVLRSVPALRLLHDKCDTDKNWTLDLEEFTHTQGLVTRMSQVRVRACMLPCMFFFLFVF
jgi:hypothetical protein